MPCFIRQKKPIASFALDVTSCLPNIVAQHRQRCIAVLTGSEDQLLRMYEKEKKSATPKMRKISNTSALLEKGMVDAFGSAHKTAQQLTNFYK